MRDFGTTMARLQGLRRKFEALLDEGRTATSAARQPHPPAATALHEIAAFGQNPGNLRMFIYLPDHLPPMAPLVVALHGCSQNAHDYDHGSGWSALADRLGFAVVYPEQQPANNPKNCFSWFLPGDTARGHGEAQSIRAMIAHAVTTFAIDPRRVFVTGLSAGGAMASVMLATYPEVFAGGAIIAGLPYGCARNTQQAFEAMFTEQSHSAAALGDRVRAASPHRGAWPKISVWHGSADPIVKPSNAEDIIRQWTDVHGLAATPSYEETIGGRRRRVWNDADGAPLIEAFSIAGMAHGVPLATSGAASCGTAGPFFLDVGISSAHHIADFWRLAEAPATRPRAAAPTPKTVAPARHPPAIAAAAIDGAAAARRDADAGDDAGRQTIGATDPNSIITAAFKAAGLPIPEGLGGRLKTGRKGGPGPIIAAALKAAGLKPL